MKKIILIFTALCILSAGQAFASMMNFSHEPNDLATATGIVQATGLNSIKIYDEDRKRMERFIYLQDNEQFHQGDYIRIFFHPKTAVVAIIKRMTVLKYNENGQNLGYISKG